MQDRLLTALGAVAAAVAVVAGFALLLSVLDEGGGGSPSTTVIVRVPAGQTASGAEAKPGHAAVGARAPGVAGAEGGGVREGGGGAGSGAAAEAAGATAAGAAAEAGGTRAAGPGADAGRGAGAGVGEEGGAAPTRPARVPTLARRPRRGVAFAIAHVRAGAKVDLRAAPGGPVVAKVGDETEFGSPVAFSVVRTKPGWLGVTAPELPNGELGWIARDPAEVDLYWTRYSLRVSLADRSLELRYGHDAVAGFAVTVGGPGTETPPGRYGVTDGVSFDESPYYGCCALALSGHQYAELPAGWIGGNRLAIHGTPGAVGGAESLGCIRATDETMRYLFARVPLGTPVFIAG
ncbi:MAG TPA: L,D-transpeptidase [Solirubrobacterales bacterium]|nr:L,D-transpeptidase [Solirubrobacterales bacterium]